MEQEPPGGGGGAEGDGGAQNSSAHLVCVDGEAVRRGIQTIYSGPNLPNAPHPPPSFPGTQNGRTPEVKGGAQKTSSGGWVWLSHRREEGPQAGHKALHTRIAWNANADMSGSSFHIPWRSVYQTIYLPLVPSRSNRRLSIARHRLVALRLGRSAVARCRVADTN